MSESKLWQLRAGIITESEYQENIKEEDPPGDQPAPTTQGAVPEKKPVTSASQLAVDIIDKAKELKSSAEGLQGGEIQRLDIIFDKLLDAARKNNFAAALSQIEANLDSKIKSAH